MNFLRFLFFSIVVVLLLHPRGSFAINRECILALEAQSPEHVSAQVFDSLKKHALNGVRIELVKAILPKEAVGTQALSSLFEALKTADDEKHTHRINDNLAGINEPVRLHSEILKVRGVPHLLFKQQDYLTIVVLPGQQTALNRVAAEVFNSGRTVLGMSRGISNFESRLNRLHFTENVFLGVEPLGQAEQAVITEAREYFLRRYEVMVGEGPEAAASLKNIPWEKLRGKHVWLKYTTDMENMKASIEAWEPIGASVGAAKDLWDKLGTKLNEETKTSFLRGIQELRDQVSTAGPNTGSFLRYAVLEFPDDSRNWSIAFSPIQHLSFKNEDDEHSAKELVNLLKEHPRSARLFVFSASTSAHYHVMTPPIVQYGSLLAKRLQKIVKYVLIPKFDEGEQPKFKEDSLVIWKVFQ